MTEVQGWFLVIEVGIVALLALLIILGVRSR
jgi:hypothetical protein